MRNPSQTWVHFRHEHCHAIWEAFALSCFCASNITARPVMFLLLKHHYPKLFLVIKHDIITLLWFSL